MKDKRYNIIIRSNNKIKNQSNGEIKTHTLTKKQINKLINYLHKNYPFNWQLTEFNG
jgi:hypothetical protein